MFRRLGGKRSRINTTNAQSFWMSKARISISDSLQVDGHPLSSKCDVYTDADCTECIYQRDKKRDAEQCNDKGTVFFLVQLMDGNWIDMSSEEFAL